MLEGLQAPSPAPKEERDPESGQKCGVGMREHSESPLPASTSQGSKEAKMQLPDGAFLLFCASFSRPQTARKGSLNGLKPARLA